MTDRQLAHAWRTSYLRLRRAQAGSDSSGVAHAARVTAERAIYLDELQRRHPAHFGAWRVADTRSPSGPGHNPARLLPRQRSSPED